ncbi:TetR family transcriptional regulator [Hyalangium rubrum]|uniref:TetR family transcriptional regulator n=1 Tax=Hyalangium rubrum TaxID=3103134 RepID=A0ABU5H1M4_9BACT|nr:TetR family transcriptional regulator [Hyalangium sp. s54d21]MDY7226663.1 TetR family transcriptional regulator [Hyalangium sp. s54d21]
MKRHLPSLLLCLLLGAPAWAASELEAVRAKAQVARSQVRTLRERQQALRLELNGVAGRIETLKAERQGKLTAGPELEQALRRSQELSGELTGLAQAVSGAEGESERSHLALYTTLSEELSRVRAAWDSATAREERNRLLSRMRELRTERDAVRSALPTSRVPALSRAEASDDPEDLLEQADALRDSEDKVRQRLTVLKARITEVREEKALERRMNDFLGEESMFDEQDRRLRLRLNASQDFEVDATPSPRRDPYLADDAEVGHIQNPPAAPGSDRPPEGGAPIGTPPGTSPPTLPTPSDPAPSTPSARASDTRPQVEALRAQQLATGDFDDLGSLEAEAKRLESLARELDSRASTLERKVRELE